MYAEDKVNCFSRVFKSDTRCSNPGEGDMSLSRSADVHDRPKRSADHKQHTYSFVLALVCIVLALVLITLVFTPVTIGSGINSEILLVGP